MKKFSPLDQGQTNSRLLPRNSGGFEMNTKLKIATFKDVEMKTLEKAWRELESSSQPLLEGKEEFK